MFHLPEPGHNRERARERERERARGHDHGATEMNLSVRQETEPEESPAGGDIANKLVWAPLWRSAILIGSPGLTAIRSHTTSAVHGDRRLGAPLPLRTMTQLNPGCLLLTEPQIEKQAVSPHTSKPKEADGQNFTCKSGRRRHHRGSHQRHFFMCTCSAHAGAGAGWLVEELACGLHPLQLLLRYEAEHLKGKSDAWGKEKA